MAQQASKYLSRYWRALAGTLESVPSMKAPPPDMQEVRRPEGGSGRHSPLLAPPLLTALITLQAASFYLSNWRKLAKLTRKAARAGECTELVC